MTREDLERTDKGSLERLCLWLDLDITNDKEKMIDWILERLDELEMLDFCDHSR